MVTEYISMAELADYLGFNKYILYEYTCHYTLSKYVKKLQLSHSQKRKYLCYHFLISEQSLTALREYLQLRRYKPQTQHIINLLKKKILELKSKKKVDIGFWDKNGEYKLDFQEVDFSKE